jgi:hypothetical protein
MWQIALQLMGKSSLASKFLPANNGKITPEDFFKFAQSKTSAWNMRFETGWSFYPSQVYFFANDMHDSNKLRSLQFLKIFDTKILNSVYEYMFLELRELTAAQDNYKKQFGVEANVIEWIDYGGTMSLGASGEHSDKISHFLLHNVAQGFGNYHTIIDCSETSTTANDSKSIWSKIAHMFGLI